MNKMLDLLQDILLYINSWFTLYIQKEFPKEYNKLHDLLQNILFISIRDLH